MFIESVRHSQKSCTLQCTAMVKFFLFYSQLTDITPQARTIALDCKLVESTDGPLWWSTVGQLWMSTAIQNISPWLATAVQVSTIHLFCPSDDDDYLDCLAPTQTNILHDWSSATGTDDLKLWWFHLIFVFWTGDSCGYIFSMIKNQHRLCDDDDQGENGIEDDHAGNDNGAVFSVISTGCKSALLAAGVSC